MATLLNSESSLLEKLEVFNCLTAFQCAQLAQLKQWSLLHANQAIVPQATPVPGFERLMLLPQIAEQDVPASTKPSKAANMYRDFFLVEIEIERLRFGTPTFVCSGVSKAEKFQPFHYHSDISFTSYVMHQAERFYLVNKELLGSVITRINLSYYCYFSAFGLTHKKSFLDDLGDVDDLFNGPSECSMFNLDPEKDIDQVPERTDFDEFLDEVLSEQGSYAPPSVLNNEAETQESYELVHSQPNSPLNSQPSDPFCSQSLHSQLNSPLHSQPNSPLNSPLHSQPSSPIQSQCNNSLHSQPNSPFQSQPNSPFQSQPNSPFQSQPNSLFQSQPNSPFQSQPSSSCHSQPSSPYYSQPNSPLQSQPDSPLDNPVNSLSCSPPVSPVSPSISEAGSNTYSTDEGIGSQSDISECGDDPELLLTKTGRRKRGPRPQVKYRGDGPMQLWQFLLELLIAPEYSKLVKWTEDEDYEFKILKPSQVATMWGEKKNKPTMNYEKLSRGLRYYYGKSVIEKVHGKRYVYLFKCDIPKILGYDPMVTVKREDCVEDSVCGEPIMSPGVEDLLVSSSAKDGAFL